MQTTYDLYISGILLITAFVVISFFQIARSLKASWEGYIKEYGVDQKQTLHVDPEEEKRILAKERKASIENFHTTLRRHTLVLKKRDLMRKKSEEEKKKEISRLLAAEGFELDSEDE